MKPAIFNTEMVKAILDGRKTQTRRIASDTAELVYRFAKSTPSAPHQVGDIIYVREKFCIGTIDGNTSGHREYWCIRQYDESDTVFYFADCHDENGFCDSDRLVKWKPSIHMPKKHARLFLRVKDVRIERLNEISDEDAKAEGIEHFKSGFKSYGKHFCENTICPPIESFLRLWESIYGNGAFDNRFVWVIEFKPISKEEAIDE